MVINGDQRWSMVINLYFESMMIYWWSMIINDLICCLTFSDYFWLGIINRHWYVWHYLVPFVCHSFRIGHYTQSIVIWLPIIWLVVFVPNKMINIDISQQYFQAEFNILSETLRDHHNVIVIHKYRIDQNSCLIIQCFVTVYILILLRKQYLYTPHWALGLWHSHHPSSLAVSSHQLLVGIPWDMPSWM